MRNLLGKFRLFLAAVLLLAVSGVTTVGLVYAGNGNNGTIKMDNSDLDGGNDNNPHLACGLTVEWFGFDSGPRSTTVVFEAQAPTGSGQLLTDTSSFTGSGNGSTLDFSKSYNLSGVLTNYAPQAQQGYHVKLTVTTDASKGNDTKSKVFWIEPCVQATAPTTTAPTCNTQTETVIPPSIAGIVWSPAGSTQLTPGQSVTYTASADTGYGLVTGSQTTWSFTNSFDSSKCGQVEGDTTTAAIPTAPQAIAPTCEVQSETITPPSITGIIWNPSGQTVLDSATTTITYTASAAAGYSIPDGTKTSWDFTYSFDSDCEDNTPTTVTPTEPQVTSPNCNAQSETVTPPEITGVAWDPSSPTTLGVGGSVTYTATTTAGYTFPGNVKTSWNFTNSFNSSDCPRVLGDSVTVITPADPDPTFADATCTSAGSYTVVAKEGVVYKDASNNVLAAGTYSAVTGSTITITAYPLNESFEFPQGAQTVWTHTFAPPICGQVLGDSTVAGSPQVLGASTLSDTGASPIVPEIIAGSALVVSILVFSRGRQPRSYRATSR